MGHRPGHVMRVGIICIQQESNTFLATPTTLRAFEQDRLFRGQAIRPAVAQAQHEVGGFFQGLDAAGIEAVPLLMAVAVPGGIVTDQTLQTLMNMMFDELDHAGRLDGLLVAPHGAAVAHSQPDMDGYWLTLPRRRVGSDVPIVCTLDLHANVSQRMIDACDATISYRTNPHLDQRARGVEAAQLIARTLRGEVKPIQAAAFPPLAINIERQLTRDQPCRSLMAKAEEIRSRPGVLATSVNLGFPYSDVPEMGCSFIVVTDGDASLARGYARELSEFAWQRRHSFIGELIDPQEAIDRALRSPRPVCLLDMGDNVGGGSPGDGTVLAHALAQRGITAFVALYDPDSARQAIDAGAGTRLMLRMGGKTDELHGRPLEALVTVRSIHEGRFTETQVRHGGRTVYDMGATAIVQTDSGLTIQLTSLRTVPFSLGQLTSCGVDPAQFDIIVVKGVHAPVAAYEQVCKTLIRTNTPGVTTADMGRLPYRHRRRPLFPFEPL
ncbi:MAG TPA: M81 family metallopeptidase [Tepidisphaeraceae bacterium]|nr:M81 family metallopeptidase [Tepidisphaeraceae bacterium]